MRNPQREGDIFTNVQMGKKRALLRNVPKGKSLGSAFVISRPFIAMEDPLSHARQTAQTFQKQSFAASGLAEKNEVFAFGNCQVYGEFELAGPVSKIFYFNHVCTAPPKSVFPETTLKSRRIALATATIKSESAMPVSS